MPTTTAVLLKTENHFCLVSQLLSLTPGTYTLLVPNGDHRRFPETKSCSPPVRVLANSENKITD